MEEAITALLAPVAGGRRHWVRAPQTTPRPYVVMQRIDGLVGYTMKGEAGHTSSRIQLDCYADSYGSAKATARSIKDILSGYRSGFIQGVFLDSERDLPVSDAGEVNNLFRTTLDIVVHHGEET